MVVDPASLRFPVEQWTVRELGLDRDPLAQSESIFALSNGHIGVRGNLDEGVPRGLPGTYVNSFYETRPLPCAEAGYGFPETLAPGWRVYRGTESSRSRRFAALDFVPRYRVDAGCMRTREVAERAGVNTQTLRYYERRGILPNPPRSPAGYRDYPGSAVEALRFVKRAQELGFTLAEVEELLDLAEGGPESCDAARSLAEAHTAELESKIADLQRMLASLATLVDTCHRPRADRSCPLLDTLASDVAPIEVSP